MASVFIGSSTEARPVAERVAQELTRADLRPLKWWEMFSVGDLTLDRLRSLSDSTDGAVLVWDSDDTTWHRGREVSSTRDNCILEYGMMVSKLGRQRTAVLVKEDVRTPTDISGITVVTYNDGNRDQRIRQLVDELRRNLRPHSPDIVPIYIDRDVHATALDPGSFPREWAGRALYASDAGAVRWLKLAKDPSYPMGIVDALGVQSLYVDVVKRWIPPGALRQIERIVSLGPGDAHNERQLLDALASEPADRLFEWVPVDISHGLLSLSVARLMGSHAIPMGIVGDHEDGLSFIFDSLIPDGSIRPSLLVTMFGGTFANLNGRESGFLGQLKARLESNDYVLLDAPVKGASWSVAADSRAHVESYSRPMREFIGGGLADRLGLPEQGILDEFALRVRADVGDGSDVPGSTCISLLDSESGQLLLRLRRYEQNALAEWLEQQGGLEVVNISTTSVPANAPDVIRMAVILLRKR
jgi:hypothetical protein